MPLGIWYPSYTSSSVVLCASPRGVTVRNELRDIHAGIAARQRSPGFHRRHSQTIQSIQGRDILSLKVGKRSEPTTRSISACAFFRTFGYTVTAKKNDCTAETDWGLSTYIFETRVVNATHGIGTRCEPIGRSPLDSTVDSAGRGNIYLRMWLPQRL